MDRRYNNIQHAWLDVMEEAEDIPILKVTVPESTHPLSYRAGTFFRRSIKISHSFLSDLNMPPGTRVAVMPIAANDFALVIHGLWLARLVPVIIPARASDKVLEDMLKQNEVKAVVFKSSDINRLYPIIGKGIAVEHWIVSDSTSDDKNKGLLKLENLLITAPLEQDIPGYTSSDCEGLIYFSLNDGELKTYSFSQKQLIDAAYDASAFYDLPEDADAEDIEEIVCNTLPLSEFNSLLHSFLVPIFTEAACYVYPKFELKDFWNEILAGSINYILLSQGQLRIILKKGRLKSWKPPKDLKIGVFTNTLLSSDLIVGFHETFNIMPYTCYSLTNVEGIVSFLPFDLSEDEFSHIMTEHSIPSSGVAVEGMSIKILDEAQNVLKVGQLGEIYISSEIGRTNKKISEEDLISLGGVGYLKSGDEGFVQRDSQGREHIFVVAKKNELIHRKGEVINPAEIDHLIYNIRGVEFARTIGFSNNHVGSEVGAFVVTLRAANLTESDIRLELRRVLSRANCPKVIVFGERTKSGTYPSRKKLAKRFVEFRDRNFNME